jgi:hypothetical protein
MTTPPRFVFVAVAAAVVSLLLLVTVTWQIQRLSDAETRSDCERAVAVREDGRAMWLYLVDTSTADQARVDAFVIELNNRLPSLHCVDGNPVPVDR